MGGPEPVEGRLMWAAALLPVLVPNPGFFTVEEWSFLIPPNAESAAVKPCKNTGIFIQSTDWLKFRVIAGRKL